VDELRREFWTDLERDRRRAWLRLSYRERLDWLWQAKAFAARAMLSARRRATPPGETSE